MYDKYFKQSEIDEMHSHEHEGENSSSIEDAWNQWLGKMQTAFSSGADPQSSEVQELMRHWNDMAAHLTGGDDKRLKAFNDLLHNEPQARKDHGISNDLFEFMAKASGGH